MKNSSCPSRSRARSRVDLKHSRWLALAATACLATPASAEWTIVRDEEGIVVEAQEVPERALPILRSTTTIDGTASELLAWIRDVSTYTQWMHDCKEARLLDRDGNAILLYNRIEAPWPVSDRDVVLRSELVRLPHAGSARVEFRSTDAISYAPDASVVRMPHLIGHYALEPDPNGGTRIEYQVDSDPGGSLPDWLVRRTTLALPFNTLRNLRARVEAK
jgi:hypothetical protein